MFVEMKYDTHRYVHTSRRDDKINLPKYEKIKKKKEEITDR
jgi:hypothetical protein